MTDEEAMALSNCGRGCYIIGGPWISYAPDCPIHGIDARQKEHTPSELDEAVRLLAEARRHPWKLQAVEIEPKCVEPAQEFQAEVDAYLAKYDKVTAV